MADAAARSILPSLGYSDISLLGAGAFGSVFKCLSATGEWVAIKLSFESQARASAALEAEFLSLLPRHPNVLPLVSFMDTPDYTITCLPLATGGDTLKFMQERGCTALPEDDARPLFIQLLDGLDHMHSNGIIHRDIKCENILLTGPRRRDVIIADLGFAGRWARDQKLTEPWGSLHYSSPEIIAHAAYEGPEVDIWSAGVVLYAWCSGRLPFGGNSEEDTGERIMAASFNLPRHFSGELKNLIVGMLDPNPATRLTVESIRRHAWVTRSALQYTPTAAAPAVPRRETSCPQWQRPEPCASNDERTKPEAAHHSDNDGSKRTDRKLGAKGLLKKIFGKNQQ